MKHIPIVALVGRPNVGKSTIFNRLVGFRSAITSHVPGTTRDRHFGVAKWFGHQWTIVDTAGLVDADLTDMSDELASEVSEQIAAACDQADIITFVIDGKTELTAADYQLAETLRHINKPIVVLVNKADNATMRQQADRFSSLGFNHIFAVSALHGSGFTEFTEFLQAKLPSPTNEDGPRTPSVSFVGRPNVGKSTLLNQLVGSKRAAVSSIPGTTRDSVAEAITLPSGRALEIVDTAGIRRRGKIEAGIEKFSMFRTLRAINQSDIVVVLISVEEPVARGDAHIVNYALEAGKKVIVALNKSDLFTQNIFRWTEHKRHNMAQRLLSRFVFINRLPHVMIAAQTGAGIDDLLALIDKTIEPST